MLSFLEITTLDIAATRYLFLATVTLLLYDHVLTLGDEISLIWPAKFGLLKAIYFFNRYIVTIWIIVSYNVVSGEATFLTTPFCRGWILTNMCLEAVALQTTSFVAAVRVYDIWNRPRRAFVILGLFWLTHCAIDFSIVTTTAIREAAGFRHEPIFNICFADVTGVWVGWLNGIIYHALVLSLLAWVWASIPRSTQTPFVKLVVRDGVLYFVAIFTMMLFNLLIWRYGRASLAALPYWSTWAVTTQALSRLLLSMGSVQDSSEWGQHAAIAIPSIDVELGTFRDREPKEVNVISDFKDDGTIAGSGMRISVIGKLS